LRVAAAHGVPSAASRLTRAIDAAKRLHP